MFIIQDAKELTSQGQSAGTLLVNHQFAESYANRGYYMYSDLEDFLGLTFMADRTTMLPYYNFIRKYPEAFTNLNQKNNLAVVFPPRMNTANPNQKNGHLQYPPHFQKPTFSMISLTWKRLMITKLSL